MPVCDELRRTAVRFRQQVHRKHMSVRQAVLTRDRPVCVLDARAGLSQHDGAVGHEGTVLGRRGLVVRVRRRSDMRTRLGRLLLRGLQTRRRSGRRRRQRQRQMRSARQMERRREHRLLTEVVGGTATLEQRVTSVQKDVDGTHRLRKNEVRGHRPMKNVIRSTFS